MSNPIPRRMLPHSAGMYTYTGTVTSKKTYAATEIDLQFVRFEAARKNAMTSLGDKRNDRFVLFFDCKNSRPLDQVFSVNDKVIFGTVELFVREVLPCYGDTTAVHHYEVALV